MTASSDRSIAVVEAASLPRGNVDRDACPRAGGRDHVHSSSGRLDANTLRRESDVAVCEPFGQLLDREPSAVVRDAELELCVGLDEAKRHLGRLRVPNDVGQELTGRREQELLLRMAGLVAKIELELQVRAARCLSTDRTERGLEPPSSST